MVQIDKNVPMPEEPLPRGFLQELEVGDSVLLPLDNRQHVMMSASQFKRRIGKEFATRKIDDEHFRIWRIK